MRSPELETAARRLRFHRRQQAGRHPALVGTALGEVVVAFRREHLDGQLQILAYLGLALQACAALLGTQRRDRHDTTSSSD